ncbi:YdiY family protein [Blastopirellula marina]|uniref:DUF481 domain-containing protein n=1 Tax=Blastopirellula marina TaxID=124 RepID=UPI0011B0ABDF|nr:DUF481 domain-containing protein [Blastopirellula marina]
MPVTATRQVDEVEFVHYLQPDDGLRFAYGDIQLLPPIPEVPKAENPATAPAEEPPADSAATLPPAEQEKSAEEEPAAEQPAEEVPPPEEKPPEIPEETIEELEEEKSYGYLDYVPYGQYYAVDYWFGDATWKKSAELGFNGQTGNTETTSLRVGAKIRREGAATIFTSEFKHLRTSDKEGLTQNNAFFKHKLDWPLKLHENWSLFENTSLEYDEFKAFDMRLVFNGGVSYKPYKTDATDWTLSVGSGFSQEFGSPQKGIIPEATMGSDFSHKITDSQKIALNTDFFPAFAADQGYRFTVDASYTVALDHGLSFKLSAFDRYDSTPNDRKRNDLDYACLLLWEF